MNLFYAPGLTENDTSYILDEEESNHCLRAVRKGTGQNIFLTNGTGLIAEGIISGKESGCCTVSIWDTRREAARQWKLEMAVAPTKNHERFEWFAEKATEIGIESIVPLICRHSERTRINSERLNRIMISAMKQSNNCYLPLVFPETEFNDFIGKEHGGQKFIAWCGDDEIPELKNKLESGKDVLILIGPEGDFTSEEIMLAKKNGFVPISLGKNRLRTETAAMVACHTANLMNDV